jgi:hypothetical protein
MIRRAGEAAYLPPSGPATRVDLLNPHVVSHDLEDFVQLAPTRLTPLKEVRSIVYRLARESDAETSGHWKPFDVPLGTGRETYRQRTLARRRETWKEVLGAASLIFDPGERPCADVAKSGW